MLFRNLTPEEIAPRGWDPLLRWNAPPPCPVDDTPFHACVPPGYEGRSDRVVIVHPFTVATSVTIPPSTPAPAPQGETREEFSTSEYRGRSTTPRGRR